MPEIADPPVVRCYSLHPGSRIEQSQSLDPDLSPPHARRAPAPEPGRASSGRFAKGHSGNPAGRPRGIPNPKRRLLTAWAWRKNPQAASALLDRKPHLLRALLAQVLPPASAWHDPAERLGISLSSLNDAADFKQALLAVWAAVAAGEIGPSEAGRLARRVRTRMRGVRRLARLQRRLARLLPPPQPSPQAGEGVRAGAENG